MTKTPKREMESINEDLPEMQPIHALSRILGQELTGHRLRLAVAESCTGGLIAHSLTNVPGSSSWFAGGIVAYANDVKTRLLFVSVNEIAAYGAVSREVVSAMAVGVKNALQTDAALAVSGIAGPGGGSPEKPVGTVWIAWSLGQIVRCERYLFSGTRLQIKKQTTVLALEGMLAMLCREPWQEPPASQLCSSLTT